MDPNPFSAPQRDQASSERRSDRRGPVGLGGWLVLVGIGLLAGLVIGLLTLVQNFQVMTGEVWAVLTTPGSEAYDPMWGPAILIETILVFGILIFNVLVLRLFFLKKASFPKIFIAYAVTNLVVRVLDLGICMSIDNFPPEAMSQQLRSVIQAGIYAAIWCAYMVKSVRVANTFDRV